MRLLALFSILLAAVALVGCGGETKATTSIVTGSVVDADFNPVRGATVRAAGQTTYTSETGAYQFTGLPEDEVEIIAELRDGNLLFRGRTWVFNSPRSQQRSANIIMAAESDLATLRGTVRDRDGFVLQGATVFAYFGTGSSTRVFTDRNGEFILRDLVANVTYTISASGQSYRSDQTNVVLNNGETRTLNFTLDNPGLPNLVPPQNVGITSWVSYPGDNRGPGEPTAMDWMKSHMDKGKDRTFAPRSRNVRNDMIVEVELFWDQQQFEDLLGFGVYRATGFTTNVQALDFYFDPLAPYYQDVGLNPNSSYSYALTTLATLYPDYNQTESDFSDVVGVYTLDLLRVNGVTGTFSNPTFNWQGGTGAEEYIVYVFDRYPDIGINYIWSNENNPTTGTSLTYNGPTLQAGRTYYYIVLGGYDFFSARTISQVESFIR